MTTTRTPNRIVAVGLPVRPDQRLVMASETEERWLDPWQAFHTPEMLLLLRQVAEQPSGHVTGAWWQAFHARASALLKEINP